MAFDRFIQGLSIRSDKTAKTYANRLKSLSVEEGFANPDELIEAVKSGKRDPYDLLEGAIHRAHNRGLSPKTQNFTYAVLKRFLEDEAEIEWQTTKLHKVSRLKPKARTISMDGIPTDQEIFKLLQNSKLQCRTFLMIGLTSGMRLGEIVNLDLSWIDFKSTPTTVRLPGEATKSRESRTTFLSKETTVVLKEFLNGRTEGPVFPSPSDPKKPLTFQALYLEMQRTLEKCDLRTKMTANSYTYRLHPHSLRKWFHTKLEAAGCPKNVVDLLCGHSLGLDGSYSKFSEDDLAKEYLKCESVLTFFGVSNGETKKIVEKQGSEIEELRKTVKDQEEATELLLRMIATLKPGLLAAQAEDFKTCGIDVSKVIKNQDSILELQKRSKK